MRLIQHEAEQGVAGAGSELPHLGTIQRSFGRHDVSGVRAHIGGDAAAATTAIGAEAFALGDRVAFGGAPTLHTAAHEAAHVVQQRAGVQLLGGVGGVRDEHERHADEVADRVVAGQSAEGLLDRYSGGGAPARGVQGKFVLPTGERLKSKVAEQLVKGFRESARCKDLEQGLSSEAIEKALTQLSTSRDILLCVDPDERDGVLTDGNYKLIAEKITELSQEESSSSKEKVAKPRGDYEKYKGTSKVTTITQERKKKDGNLVVGRHFFRRAVGESLMAGLASGQAEILGLVGVDVGNFAVDSIEWGFFQFKDEERYFLVRSSEGEVDVSGEYSVDKGVILLAHTHPANPKDKISKLLPNIGGKREDKRDEKSEKSGFEDLGKVKVEDGDGIPLLRALEAQKAQKILGYGTEIWHLFPSDADFSQQGPGDLTYTPYRYNRETGMLFNFGPKQLPILIWETVSKEIFFGKKVEKKSDCCYKVHLRLFAADLPGVTIWECDLYSQRLVMNWGTTSIATFDPDEINTNDEPVVSSPKKDKPTKKTSHTKKSSHTKKTSHAKKKHEEKKPEEKKPEEKKPEEKISLDAMFVPINVPSQDALATAGTLNAFLSEEYVRINNMESDIGNDEETDPFMRVYLDVRDKYDYPVKAETKVEVEDIEKLINAIVGLNALGREKSVTL